MKIIIQSANIKHYTHEKALNERGYILWYFPINIKIEKGDILIPYFNAEKNIKFFLKITKVYDSLDFLTDEIKEQERKYFKEYDKKFEWWLSKTKKVLRTEKITMKEISWSKEDIGITSRLQSFEYLKEEYRDKVLNAMGINTSIKNKKSKLDLRWMKAVDELFKYNKFTNIKEIIDDPLIKKLEKIEGGEYKDLYHSIQTNLAKYSIEENGEWTNENIIKKWSLLIKEKGYNAYKKNDNFDQQLEKLISENVSNKINDKKKLMKYVTDKNQEELSKELKTKKEIVVSESTQKIYQEEKVLYIKKRDDKFVRLAKEMFFIKNPNGECQECGYSFINESYNKYIELHHKKHFSKTKELKKGYKNLDEINKDFKFLCSNCHTKEHLKN